MARKTKDPQDSPLPPEQQRAAIMLIEGASQRDVAADLDMSEFTISRWVQTPEFRAYQNALLLDMRATAINKIRTLQTKALATIEELLEDKEAPHHVRLNAACKVLEHAGHGFNSAGILPILDTDAKKIREKDIQNEVFGRSIDNLSRTLAGLK